MSYLTDAMLHLGIYYTPACVLALDTGDGKTGTWQAILANPPFRTTDPGEEARGITDYEYKINPKDRCMILCRPVGSLMGFGVYGTFATTEQARRILSLLQRKAAEGDTE